ncbi:hypothetical protein DFJ73DRAFT_564350 [Zopfochytrium polystomum]|nr:hypothetical protein DFJ73DRAFT_564350 [Zopfochytrium polystomum]
MATTTTTSSGKTGATAATTTSASSSSPTASAAVSASTTAATTTPVTRSTIPTPSALPSISNGCLYLDDTTPCGATYKAFPVRLNLGGSFENQDQFSEMFRNFSDPSWTTDFITSYYACPSTNRDAILQGVTRMRYALSTLCAQYVFESVLSGCPVPAGLAIDGPLLCQSQCSLGGSDLKAVIAGCQSSARISDKNSRIDEFCSQCSSRTAENGGCGSGIQVEVAACGYRNVDIGVTACAANSSDPCCAQLLATASTTSTQSGTSSASNIIFPVVGGVIAFLVLVALVILFFFLQRRKKNAAKGYVHESVTFSAVSHSAKEPLSLSFNAPTGLNDESLDRPSTAVSTRNGTLSLERRQRTMQMQHTLLMQPTEYAANMGPVQMEPIQAGLIFPTASAPTAVAEVAPAPEPTVLASPTAVPTAILLSPPTAAETEEQNRASRVSTSIVSTDSSASSMDRLVRVIHPYKPALPDELELKVNADLILLKKFDDGWALGLDLATGRQGAFPVPCVIAKEDWVGEPTDGRESIVESEVSVNGRVSSALFDPVELERLKRASLLVKAIPGYSFGPSSSSSSSASFLSVASSSPPTQQEASKPKLLHANSKSVKFDSGVPPEVYVYPRESLLSIAASEATSVMSSSTASSTEVSDQ